MFQLEFCLVVDIILQIIIVYLKEYRIQGLYDQIQSYRHFW